MRYLALGLGVLITNFALKPLYFAVFFRSGATVNIAFYRMQLLAEICLVIGLLIGWFLERRLALKSRLPNPVPGYKALKVGVWIFFLVWAIFIASRTIPYAVYLIGAFPTRYLIEPGLPGVLANVLITYGVARIFLSANPPVKIDK